MDAAFPLLPRLNDVRVAVIGLGYVGLPLAVEFSKGMDTVGFAISAPRIAKLRAGRDRTGEVEDLSVATRLRFASDLEEIRDCNVYVIAVPTPIDADHRPDLTPLIRASETVGEVIGKVDVVIYESTVYPAADAHELTEEYGLDLVQPEQGAYDAMILAVPHRQFIEAGPAALRAHLRPGGVFFDLEAVFDGSDSDLRL